MTQSYTANKVYDNEGEKQVLVTSARCRYSVWLSAGVVSLRGPGVDESSETENFDQYESFEDFAIYVVLLFENGLWPEE